MVNWIRNLFDKSVVNDTNNIDNLLTIMKCVYNHNDDFEISRIRCDEINDDEIKMLFKMNSVDENLEASYGYTFEFNNHKFTIITMANNGDCFGWILKIDNEVFPFCINSMNCNKELHFLFDLCDMLCLHYHFIRNERYYCGLGYYLTWFNYKETNVDEKTEFLNKIVNDFNN